MEEADDVTKPARRTRSAAKVTKTPPAKAQKPKPLSKKTRKKVVLMEVEVSDDEEEETVIDNIEEKNETTEKEDLVDKDSPERAKKSEEEKVELNGSKNNDISTPVEDTDIVILNDVTMFQEEKDTKVNKEQDKSLEKMEVDEKISEIKRQEKNMEKSEEPNDSNKKRDSENLDEPDKKKIKLDSALKQVETGILKTVEKAKEEKAETSQNNLTIEKEEEKLNIVKSEEKETSEKSKEIFKTESAQEKEATKTEIPEENLKAEKIEEITKVKKSEVQAEVRKPEVQAEVEKPEVQAKVEKPEVQAKVEKPEEQAKVEKPKEQVKVEKQQSKVENPEEAKVEKSDEQAKVEIPKEQAKVEKPKEQAKVEKPEEQAKVEKLKEQAKVEKPEEQAKVEKPEGQAKADNSELTKESEKPDEKTKAEKSEKNAAEESEDKKEKADPDTENISEDELPEVQAVKVPEAEEVSDEELPGPKRAELPADTEVVSEDELPTVKNEVKKESSKRKIDETDYDPGSPTSENEAPSKKPSLETSGDKEKEEPKKPKKLPELDKYWKAVNDDPTDFTGWTYLLQYVDQENDMEAAREAYDAFLSHYPYCYGYWRKYADYEKRKGNKKKCEEVFERGLKAIPLSVDLWIHYLTYVKTTRAEDEDFIRSQFERALLACGLEFRSDRLWDSFIKWETEGKRLQNVTAIYDRLLATPTQGYTAHFDNFQEHMSSNPPNKVIEVDEFLALRKEVRLIQKHDVNDTPADSDAPPGDDDPSKVVSSDEETKSIRERIVSIRRKIHKATVNAVTARWNYEEGIKRPYFHVKPLERCQLKNWQDYLDYETEQGDKTRIIVLFERCLIACALYEEFWLKFVHYLEGLKDPELQSKIRDVYERACTIHHLKKPNLHLQWALFEETVGNANRAAEILVNLEKSVPNVLQIAYRRINLERRRGDSEKCIQLYEHYINNSKNKMISSSISIKYSRFCFVILKDIVKAQEILKSAIGKDPNNPRLYLQLVDLTLQKENVTEKEVIEIIDMFLDKENTDSDQKILFAQRKLEYLEDFGVDNQSVQTAHEQYQKLLKLNKEGIKKKEAKSIEAPATPAKTSKEKPTTPSSTQSGSYGNYGQYGNTAQPNYPYSGTQQGPNYYPQYSQGDQQYQYQNWQYPQGGYGGYNQWGGYSGGYGY